MSFWAAIEQLFSFATPGKPGLAAVRPRAALIIVSSVLVAIEGIKAIIRATKEPPEAADEDLKIAAVREQV